MKSFRHGNGPLSVKQITDRYGKANVHDAEGILHQLVRSETRRSEALPFLISVASEGNAWSEDRNVFLREPDATLRKVAQTIVVRKFVKDLSDAHFSVWGTPAHQSELINYLSKCTAHHGHNDHDREITRKALTWLAGHYGDMRYPGEPLAFEKACLLAGCYKPLQSDSPEHFRLLLEHIRKNVMTRSGCRYFNIANGQVPKAERQAFELIATLEELGHSGLALCLARFMAKPHEGTAIAA